MFLWNLFNTLVSRPDILETILSDVEDELRKLTENENLKNNGD